jgi:hypothetical protein
MSHFETCCFGLEWHFTQHLNWNQAIVCREYNQGTKLKIDMAAWRL